jgi:hypothetical protein
LSWNPQIDATDIAVKVKLSAHSNASLISTPAISWGTPRLPRLRCGVTYDRGPSATRLNRRLGLHPASPMSETNLLSELEPHLR